MRSWNRDFCFLAFAVFSVGMFFGIYFALFFNFIENRFAIEAHELGYMEALREVPGFLNALFIAIMVYFAPPTIGGISLVVMGLGRLTNFWPLHIFAVKNATVFAWK